jgi:predicted ester cyclase
MKKIITGIAINLAFAACMPPANKNDVNDLAAKNKAAMQKFYDEVFNKHNVAMFDSITTRDYVEHASDPGTPQTREGTEILFKETFAAFPDANEKVILMLADSSYVITHYTLTGTNTGKYMGLPPTNKKINVNGMDIVRFVNGKAVEHWGYLEEMKMMDQMGTMPGMGVITK